MYYSSNIHASLYISHLDWFYFSLFRSMESVQAATLKLCFLKKRRYLRRKKPAASITAGQNVLIKVQPKVIRLSGRESQSFPKPLGFNPRCPASQVNAPKLQALCLLHKHVDQPRADTLPSH
jgi:hypothetical protein